MAEPKAIVFDADGTLLNSFELIMSAYRHVANVHGLSAPTPEEVRVELGRPLPDIFAKFYPNYDIKKLLNTNSRYMAANAMKSQAFKGVDNLLMDLYRKGYKLAVVTSGGPKINDILKHHDYLRYLSSVVHHERITHQKPDPEGLLLAVSECGVLPDETVMVGDTIYDVEAGKNAGVHSTIAVTHGFGLKTDLKRSGADYIVDNIFGVAEAIGLISSKHVQ